MAFSAPEGVNSSSEVLGFKIQNHQVFKKKKLTFKILERLSSFGGGSTVR